MTRSRWIIIALTYILSLLSTSLTIDFTVGLERWQLQVLLAGLICLTVISAIAFLNRDRAKIFFSIMMVAVATIAIVYFELRLPQPKYDDVNYQITQAERPLVQITGRVLTEPRLNDSQRVKFWFEAQTIGDEKISGKLYATLPLLQGTGIHSGQELKLTGFLYLPQPNSSPGGFDFQQYLARKGSFAGIQGTVASLEGLSQWGWWRLRQRIVRSHLRGLGSPAGQLVSSMVLGRRAVDLPNHIRDRFISAGLAHVLAASGFHVSLLLGLILRLTPGLGAKPRLAVGIITLAIYLCLTGVQASVLRACLMGVAVLLAATLETKVKPLGSLLMAATIILVINPLLIDDLGFKLSFLATFGLIVTLPPLQQRLDWLPRTIAVLIAIPLAASIWVLPLLGYEFNILATYSILVNIICTPLITIVSLVGMISGMVALILPAAGTAIASILFYPVAWLMAIVQFFTQLPASNWAVGQMPLSILLAIYGLFILIWLNKWWQQRWWLGLLLPLACLIALAVNNLFQVQIAVLPNPQSPTVVVRDRGDVTLINSGTESQAKYTVLPFLAQEGISKIDRGIAIDKNSNPVTAWEIIGDRARINSIYNAASIDLFRFKVENHSLLETIVTQSTVLNSNEELAVVNLQTASDTWLILGKGTADAETITRYIKQHDLKSQQPILVWSGNVAPTWLELLKPRMAIACSREIDPISKKILRQKQIEFYNTATAGTLRWTPQQQFIRSEATVD